MTPEEVQASIDRLLALGLIVVTGTNENGETTYGPAAKDLQ